MPTQLEFFRSYFQKKAGIGDIGAAIAKMYAKPGFNKAVNIGVPLAAGLGVGGYVGTEMQDPFLGAAAGIGTMAAARPAGWVGIAKMPHDPSNPSAKWNEAMKTMLLKPGLVAGTGIAEHGLKTMRNVSNITGEYSTRAAKTSEALQRLTENMSDSAGGVKAGLASAEKMKRWMIGSLVLAGVGGTAALMLANKAQKSNEARAKAEKTLAGAQTNQARSMGRMAESMDNSKIYIWQKEHAKAKRPTDPAAAEPLADEDIAAAREEKMAAGFNAAPPQMPSAAQTSAVSAAKTSATSAAKTSAISATGAPPSNGKMADKAGIGKNPFSTTLDRLNALKTSRV
jgi:gas vesicle protein